MAHGGGALPASSTSPDSNPLCGSPLLSLASTMALRYRVNPGEAKGQESPQSWEERESRLSVGRRGAQLRGCESLRRLDSAAESRGGDKSRGAEEQIVDSPP